MEEKELIEKIIEKREYSDLPRKDVKRVFDLFNDEEFGQDKVKKSRAMLKKIYTAFVSTKLLKVKNKETEWFLKKHTSTRERFEDYEKVYKRIFEKNKKYSIIDLGAGINGMSYEYFKNYSKEYIALEPVGQLVDLMNYHFKENDLKNYLAFKGSLFDLEKTNNLIEKTKKPRVIFLFKVLDALEIVKRNYSKKLLLEISHLAEKIVVSYATKSLISKKGFYAKRKWLKEFIQENFEIIEEFEGQAENYIIFRK